jgi:hypothetical protein
MSPTRFGRRVSVRPAAVPSPLPAMTKFSRAGNSPVLPEPVPDAVEDEIKAWKKARGPSLHLKPLALTASLCFGIASFALPATVNDWVQYPLYALSAASLYVGFRRRRVKRDRAIEPSGTLAAAPASSSSTNSTPVILNKA